MSEYSNSSIAGRPHLDPGPSQHPPKYALMTSAYNEEELIGGTIEAVVAQTLLPKRWVIVSDGSTDATDQVVENYAKRYEWIRLLHVSRDSGRSFGAKVAALHQAYSLLADVELDYLGNLDADISLDPSYYEDLIANFRKDPALGLAGGFVYEEVRGTFRSRRCNRVYSVAHAAQLLRRECYEDIGGYTVLEYGGEDWHAQITAQMKGWGIRAFPELRIMHHRHTGEGDNLLRHKFRQGRMDYSFGCDPVFEILKCLQRVAEKPVMLGSLARIIGFSWSYLERAPRPVSSGFVSFLREEQRQKISSLFREESTFSIDATSGRLERNK